MSTFRYEPASIAAIETWLSPDRLSKYLAETNNDLNAAIQLHVYNTALSAAFFGPMQIMEIALRNSFNRELVARFGTNWYEEPSFLVDDDIRLSIEKAKAELGKKKTAVDTPHMVAELHFGFWTMLLAGRYEHSIWTPALRNAFPHYPSQPGKSPKRNQISGRLTYVRGLRNRIAHHEPIFHRDLLSDYATILTIASWFFEKLDLWIEYHSRVKALIPRRSTY